MSLILSNNDFQNKTLLNTESGVEFVSADTKSISIDAIAKFALTDWAISFNLKKVSITGNTFFTQAGGITLNDTNLSGIDAGRWTNIVINKTGEIHYGGTLHHTEVAFGNLLNAITTIGTGDFIMNHLIIYDKGLTRFEVPQHVYLHGGEIRSPLHPNIVFHVPLTEKFTHKIEVGDESDGANGLVVFDRMAVDCSKRYNYIKSTVIDAQHGKFINFNDDSIGADTDQNISSLKGFYDNSEYRSIGKKYDSTIKNYDTITAWNEFEYTQKFSFLSTIIVTDVSAFLIIFNTSTVANKSLRIYYNNGAFIIFFAGDPSRHLYFKSVDITRTGEYTLLYTHDGTSSGAGDRIFVDGVEETNLIATTLTGTIINGGTQARIGYLYDGANSFYSDGFILSTEMINTELTIASEIEQANNNKTFAGLGKTYLLDVNFNKEEGQLNTKPNTPVYAIQAFEDITAVTPVTGDGNYLESNTNLPHISESLLIEGEKYVSYPTDNLPTDTEDFTLSVSGYMALSSPVSGLIDNEWEFLLCLVENTLSNFVVDGNIIRVFYNKRTNGSVRNSRLDTQNQNLIGGVNTAQKLTTQNQVKYFNNITIAVSPSKDVVRIYINGSLEKVVSLGNYTNWNTVATKRFRTGYLNYDDGTSSSEVSELSLTQMGYWKRALDGWEVASLYNNSLLGNPFKHSGFQDNLEQYYQPQKGSIYKVGAIYYVKNQADILKGTWVSAGINEAIIGSDGTAWTDAELIGATPTKIITNKSLI